MSLKRKGDPAMKKELLPLQDQYNLWKHRSVLSKEHFVGAFESSDGEDSVILDDSGDNDGEFAAFEKVHTPMVPV